MNGFDDQCFCCPECDKLFDDEDCYFEHVTECMYEAEQERHNKMWSDDEDLEEAEAEEDE